MLTALLNIVVGLIVGAIGVSVLASGESEVIWGNVFGGWMKGLISVVLLSFSICVIIAGVQKFISALFGF